VFTSMGSVLLRATLQRPWPVFNRVRPEKPKLPVVLSRWEVRSLLPWSEPERPEVLR